MGAHASVYTPTTGAYATWKRVAMEAMRTASMDIPQYAGALYVQLWFVMPLPKSKHRKTSPVKRMPCTSAAHGDIDNLVKGPLDAANGILWHDDRQVARIMAVKYVGAQGEEPYVKMRVAPIEDARAFDE